MSKRHVEHPFAGQNTQQEQKQRKRTKTKKRKTDNRRNERERGEGEIILAGWNDECINYGNEFIQVT